MHTHSLADYVDCLERGDIRGIAELMLRSAEKLALVGADFLVCPDNTIHEALPFVQARSPRPWLHIADVVAAEAASRGLRRLGLTGTRWLVAGPVYPERLAAHGIACVRPNAAEREAMDRAIMGNLVHGRIEPADVACFQAVIERMRVDGCDGVVLGCTEIPLIIDDSNAALPTLDSTRLLARAAVLRAVGAPLRAGIADGAA